jgi:tyrosyl-DNA phosphodiesterase-1
VFIVTEDDMEITDKTVIYIGSHNLSAAAWGKFEKD